MSLQHATTQPERADALIQPAVAFQALPAISLLDDVVFQADDLYTWDQATVEELQLRLITAAFEHHYTYNAAYRRYCERVGGAPSTFSSIADLARIPLITSTQFKLSTVLSSPPESIVKTCVSSGTQGSISKIYRDETTLCRFLGSVQSSIEQVLMVDDAYCLHLGPSQAEAQDLWFSYVMGATDLVFPTENYVVDGQFRPAALLERLHSVKQRYQHTLLIGAPVMFLHLIDYMVEHDLSVEGCERLMVVTAGGWKRFSGSAISRAEFEARLQTRLRGMQPQHFRDCFNMVELNTLVAECAHRVKHVPPWLHVLILDPQSLQPVAPGQMGLLAFLDPTPTSYPGFILTDDFARLTPAGACACGKHGPGIEIVRRVQKVESRGCALKIDRAYSDQARPNS